MCVNFVQNILWVILRNIRFGPEVEEVLQEYRNNAVDFSGLEPLEALAKDVIAAWLPGVWDAITAGEIRELQDELLQ